MAKKQKEANGAAPATSNGIWIHLDGHANEHWHALDGSCECETCESKPRLIIYPVAA